MTHAPKYKHQDFFSKVMPTIRAMLMDHKSYSSQPIRKYSTKPHNNNGQQVRCNSTCDRHLWSSGRRCTTAAVVSWSMPVHFSTRTQRMKIVVNITVSRLFCSTWRSSHPSTSSISKVTWITRTFYIIISVTAITRTTPRSIWRFFWKKKLK